MYDKEDDVYLLLPTFQNVVLDVMDDLRDLGFDPVLRDGLRTFDEAAANARKGTGSALSMHCYGCAADLICRVHGWGCAKAGCDFFEALGRVAEARGCVWGGRWRNPKTGRVGWDKPHIQGIRVSEQNRMRRIGPGADVAAERDALVRKHFKV